MATTISVNNILSNSVFEERIGKDETVEYVEDLIFKIASTVLEINPVGVHLFALYHQKLNLWLCPNQRLNSLQADLKLVDLHFVLKIRFLPFTSLDLFKKDPKAFEYYFYQIRNDFKQFPKRKLKDGFESEVYGIALQDELREVIENKISVDASNIKKIVDNIYNRLPVNMPRPFFDNLFPIKSKVEDSFMDSYGKKHTVFHVKSSYINQYLKGIANHYYDEEYKISYYNPKYSGPPRAKQLTYQVWDQQVCIRSPRSDNWDVLFSIKDLMYITVLSETDIEVSHVTGAPITMAFDNSLQMKSFVSLLSGYYRLSQRWNFDICKEYFSPWIDRLRRISCHGPVNYEFLKEKLNKYGDENSKHVPFIFHQSRIDFTTFIVFFPDKHTFTVKADLRKSIVDFTILDGSSEEGRTFANHQTMFDFVRTMRSSLNGKVACALIPSESDLPLNLLLCRNKNDDVKKGNKSELTVAPEEQVKKSKLVTIKNSLFCIRYGDIKSEDKVMIKEFVNSSAVGKFLDEISAWIHLQDSSIVNCKGIVVSPFSVLFEFCQTSLQDLYNERRLSDNFLVQAAYFLAKSLDFIFSKEYVHGFIRFENLYVSHYTDKTLHIKLGDPIGHRELNKDPNKEKPWLPPEYFSFSSFQYKKLTLYSDVWAFGTTLWQIFNNGERPPDDPAFCLAQSSHSLSNMPVDVSQLVTKCWLDDYTKRIQPYSILGQMSRLLSAVYEMPNQYAKLINNQHSDSVPHSLNSSQLYNSSQPYYNNHLKTKSKEKSLFKSMSRMSLSNISLNSGQTDTTSLNLVDETSSIWLHESKDLYEITRINRSDLTLLNCIGKGNYGFVIRALFHKPFGVGDMPVAVKIIPDEGEAKSLDHEIGIMTKLKHPNIVQIIGCTWIEKNCLPNDKGYTPDSYGKCKGLVMEFLELGDLKTWLSTKCGENELELPFIKFATDICEGLVFLASKSIIHRDLAARNILVKSETEVKISDFGLSHIVEDDIYKLKSNRPIPLRWLAPESITHSIFKTKSDVWSYAVLLWEMYTFCKSVPYEGVTESFEDMAKHLRNGNRLSKPSNCPPSLYAIMNDCWEYDVERRPDFESVLKKINQLEPYTV